MFRNAGTLDRLVSAKRKGEESAQLKVFEHLLIPVVVSYAGSLDWLDSQNGKVKSQRNRRCLNIGADALDLSRNARKHRSGTARALLRFVDR